MRIALAAFGLESSTFTPIKATSAELFVSRENFVSADLGQYCTELGIEIVPVFLVGGSPSGCIEDGAFTEFREANSKAQGGSAVRWPHALNAWQHVTRGPQPRRARSVGGDQKGVRP